MNLLKRDTFFPFSSPAGHPGRISVRKNFPWATDANSNGRRPTFVAQARFNWNALRRGNPRFLAIIAALCAMAVLTLLGEMYPESSYDAFEALMAWLRTSVS